MFSLFISKQIKFLLCCVLAVLTAFFCSRLLLFHSGSIFILFMLPMVAVISLKKPIWFICILVICYARGFETFDFGIPFWMFSDFSLIMLFIGCACQIFANGHFSICYRDKYFRYIGILFFLVLISTLWGSCFILNQPLRTVIFGLRWFLLYFVYLYMTLAKVSISDVKKIMKFFLTSAVVVSILVIIDAKLLGGGHIFKLAMRNGVSGIRAGQVRLFTYSFISSWMYFYTLCLLRYEKKKQKKGIYLCFFCIIFVQIFSCGMTRQLMAMLLATTAIYLFSAKFKTKIVYVLGVPIILCSLFVFNGFGFINLGDNYLAKIYEKTQEEVIQSDNKGNIALRRKGLSFFYPYFRKTIFIGFGPLSDTYKNSPAVYGRTKHYLLVDLGFFEILYKYGVFAIIFIFVVLKCLFKDISLIKKTSMSKEVNAIVDSIQYFLISKIIILPFGVLFFGTGQAMYYAIMLYFVSIFSHENNNDFAKERWRLWKI